MLCLVTIKCRVWISHMHAEQSACIGQIAPRPQRLTQVSECQCHYALPFPQAHAQAEAAAAALTAAAAAAESEGPDRESRHQAAPSVASHMDTGPSLQRSSAHASHGSSIPHSLQVLSHLIVVCLLHHVNTTAVLTSMPRCFIAFFAAGRE